MELHTSLPDQDELKILLLPFCLSKDEIDDITATAKGLGYRTVVATTTAFALSQVRKVTRSQTGSSVRIVGVVCEGRAKKVSVGLFLLKARQLLKRLVRLKTRRIYLSRVSINGGTRSMFGRRMCDIGRNSVPREDFMESLQGGRVFFVL